MARFTAGNPLLELTAAGLLACRRRIAEEVDGSVNAAAAIPLAPRKVRRETGTGMSKGLHWAV
jgi:hypothetical protein